MTNTNNTSANGNATNDQNTTVIEQQDSAKRGETTTTTLPPQQPAATRQPAAQTEQYGAQNAFGTTYGTDPRGQAPHQGGAGESAQADPTPANRFGNGYGAPAGMGRTGTAQPAASQGLPADTHPSLHSHRTHRPRRPELATLRACPRPERALPSRAAFPET